MNMVHYEPVKLSINVPGLVKVILDVVVKHHGLPNSTVSDRDSLFTSKFWSSLYNFLDIKRRLSTAYHPQINGQTERQNSTMEAYFWAFVNFEQNDWARLLPMAQFTYNNARNASIGHTPFKLNCGYHPRMLYEEQVDSRSKSKSAVKQSAELRELMIVCQKNLHHTQELQKRTHDKGVKHWSYTPGQKVWLNSKYIKTKYNRKLEAKLFGPFRVLHPVKKQAYKLELSRKWWIHNVFHVSLLEQDTTMTGWVDEEVRQIVFNAGDDGRKYKVEVIWDSVVYAKESESGHLPGFYYLIFWRRYTEEENTWEPASTIQYLRKLISSFYKDHLDKATATSPAIDNAPLMARPTAKPTEPFK